MARRWTHLGVHQWLRIGLETQSIADGDIDSYVVVGSNDHIGAASHVYISSVAVASKR